MPANLDLPQPPDDAALIASCLAGEISAFAALIDRHRSRLERLLRVLIHDRSAREDVWQETLLRAYFHLDQLRDTQRFGAWLCSIAVNQARTERSTGSESILSWETLGERATHDILALNGATTSPEEGAVRQEMANRIRRAINDLPPAERDAVLLVYLEGLSHKEVAVQLGATLSAVKVRVHRGRRRLQRTLQEDYQHRLSQARKESKMIRVQVHDVYQGMMVKPEVTDPAAAIEQVGTKPHRLILLKEETGDRGLTIWVGAVEGDQIAMHLKQEATQRPMTYDLLKTLLELGHIGVERATVARLVENTFYSNLLVRTGNSTVDVDCRPSDAINLALRLGVPIFVAEEVMDQASKPLGAPPESEVEWESVLHTGKPLCQ